MALYATFTKSEVAQHSEYRAEIKQRYEPPDHTKLKVPRKRKLRVNNQSHTSCLQLPPVVLVVKGESPKAGYTLPKYYGTSLAITQNVDKFGKGYHHRGIELTSLLR